MGDDLTDLAADLTAQFASLHLITRRPLFALDIGFAQIRVLARLTDAGPMRVSELASRLQVRQPTMTETINAMERRGLVSRRSDESDGRAVVVEASAAGREASRRARQVRAQEFAKQLRQLGPDDLDLLRRASTLFAELTERMT